MLDRVVVVRALRGLGDFLCVVPALRSLRLAAPQAHITLVGLSSSRPLVSRFSPYIDELLPFPGFPGIPEEVVEVARLPQFFVEAQARQFDLAIQMHGNGALMNPFTVMLGAKGNAGYHAPGAYCPDPSGYLTLNESDHEVRRWLRLLAHLGVPGRGEDLEFPLEPADWDGLATVPEASALATLRYVAVHPGASEAARRWSPENFAAVADHFARDGYRVVLTGTADEADVAADVAKRMRYGAINVAGRTNLGMLAALLSKASLLVSNDTGVSHLAAALRVPSVIVFMASDPRRWAPLDRQLHRVVTDPSVGYDAALSEHSPFRPAAYRELGPEAVLREARALLGRAVEPVSSSTRTPSAPGTGRGRQARSSQPLPGSGPLRESALSETAGGARTARGEEVASVRTARD